MSNNAAAMREALLKITGLFRDIDLTNDTPENEAYAIAAFALSAPARNCDRFKSVKEAAIEFSKRRDNPQPCPDFTFSEWLFEQAEERKGEVNGRK